MTKIIKAVLLASALVAAAGARASDVQVDYDKAASFAAIKTFAIKIGTGWGNEISEKRVLDEISGAIASRGWTRADEANADVLVVLHGASEKKQTLTTFYDGWSGYGYYGWGGMGMGSATTTAYEYTVGTLVIDIFDTKTKKLLWRGTAQDELKNSMDKRQKQLAKVSAKLFKDFPPGSAKKK